MLLLKSMFVAACLCLCLCVCAHAHVRAGWGGCYLVVNFLEG